MGGCHICSHLHSLLPLNLTSSHVVPKRCVDYSAACSQRRILSFAPLFGGARPPPLLEYAPRSKREFPSFDLAHPLAFPTREFQLDLNLNFPELSASQVFAGVFDFSFPPTIAAVRSLWADAFLNQRNVKYLCGGFRKFLGNAPRSGMIKINSSEGAMFTAQRLCLRVLTHLMGQPLRHPRHLFLLLTGGMGVGGVNKNFRVEGIDRWFQLFGPLPLLDSVCACRTFISLTSNI